MFKLMVSRLLELKYSVRQTLFFVLCVTYLHMQEVKILPAYACFSANVSLFVPSVPFWNE